MSGGKKASVPSEPRTPLRKDPLWCQATPEKTQNIGSFQPRTPLRSCDVSITEGILRTSVQRIDGTVLKTFISWPLSILSRSLFLAKESLELCGLGSGDLCQVSVDGNEIGIFWSWPQTFGDDKIEALATAEVIAVLDTVDNTTVAIQKWSGNVSQADAVTFKVLQDRNKGILGHQAFQAVTALSCKNAILSEGSRLVINYYGRTVTLEAETITQSSIESSDVDWITNQFEDIKLNLARSRDVETRMKHFVITDKTRLQFETQDRPKDNDLILAKEILESIGGLTDEKRLIIDACHSVLGANPSRSFVGILLHGPSGSGKTLLGKSLPALLNSRPKFISVSGPDLGSMYSGGSEAKLRSIFENAKTSDQTIIFIDEIDILCTSPDRVRNDADRRISSSLRSLIDDLTHSKTSRVILVAATGNPEIIDPVMRRPGRLDVEIEIGVPSVAARKEILQKILAQTKKLDNLSETDLQEVAQTAHGFVGADLQALCRTALGNPPLTLESFRKAFKSVKASAMRQVQVEIPDVKWSDIGGLDDLKLHLKQSVEWPIRFPQVYDRMGISPPRGILMYGPPGCSKTMIAKALANESKLNFVSIKGPELFSKWVGDSELAVRTLFDKARRVAPCILFFDEIDALGSERGGSGSGKVGDRVLAQMLTEMDGIVQLKDVTIVAATNRPDMIDKALMRPGRLDRVEYVPLPDFQTRLKVFEIHTRKKPLGSVDLNELAQSTQGYSGAEIAAVCNEAALKGLEEIMLLATTDKQIEDAATQATLTQRHFELALDMVKPRINPELLEVYEKFSQKHQS